jgi:tRNA (guanine37-N1)-methyltransferase
VPSLLRSGDHGRVMAWRRVQALVRTLQRRPDLITDRGGLTEEEVRLLSQHGEARLLREHGYD